MRLYVGVRLCPTECSTIAERGECMEHDGKEGWVRGMISVQQRYIFLIMEAGGSTQRLIFICVRTFRRYSSSKLERKTSSYSPIFHGWKDIKASWIGVQSNTPKSCHVASIYSSCSEHLRKN
jgi:hypothetical protein